MAKQMDVTIPQAMSLCAMGNDKGVDAEFVAPEGGRIHELAILVVLDEEWQSAISTGCPDTPSDYNIRKVGDQYRPSGKGTNKTRMVIVNFGPSGGSWDKAIAWAAQYPQLKRSTPRQVLAISKHKSNLHHELGFNPMYVVATTECSFEGVQQACYAWWCYSERKADLGWVSVFAGAHGWFAFFCE